MTIEIGRICVKTAGRDASKKCVIIDLLDDKYVLIDGETRRRKCNIIHIEPSHCPRKNRQGKIELHRYRIEVHRGVRHWQAD